MKIEQSIRIDRHRTMQPLGGEFARRDPLTMGKVQVIQASNEAAQAAAVVAELRRLRDLGVTDWSNLEVLSRTHHGIAQVRVLAERAGIPIRWWADRNKLPPLHAVREIHQFLRSLESRPGQLLRAADLIPVSAPGAPLSAPNPWKRFLQSMLLDWQTESNDAELPKHEALEFFYGSCAECRRDFSHGEGVTLSTVHAAKGTEHDHVLLTGGWPLPPCQAAQEEARRTLYVGMTRARKTLAIFDQTAIRPSLLESLSGPLLLHRDAPALPLDHSMLSTRFAVLGLEDIHLSHPGFLQKSDPRHRALAALEPGDRLTPKFEKGGLELFDSHGFGVARLSRSAQKVWEHRLAAIREIRVLAMVHRTIEQETDPARAERCRVTEWEVPVVEVVFDESLT